MNFEEILQKIVDKRNNVSGNRLKFLGEDSKKFIIDHTAFLNHNVSLRERVYCLRHNITCYKLCVVCNTPVVNFLNNSYSNYCSLLCSNGAKEVKQKRKKTSLEKYGVDNPFKSEEIKEKIKETNIEKYGVDNPAKNIDVQGRISVSLTDAHLVDSKGTI